LNTIRTCLGVIGLLLLLSFAWSGPGIQFMQYE
jgi:hypothetical protein